MYTGRILMVPSSAPNIASLLEHACLGEALIIIVSL